MVGGGVDRKEEIRFVSGHLAPETGADWRAGPAGRRPPQRHRDRETEGAGEAGLAQAGWCQTVVMGGGVAWTPRANEVVWGPVLGVQDEPPTGDTSVESRCWGSGLMSGPHCGWASGFLWPLLLEASAEEARRGNCTRTHIPRPPAPLSSATLLSPQPLPEAVERVVFLGSSRGGTWQTEGQVPGAEPERGASGSP